VKIFNNATADEMFLNHPLENLGAAGMIPDAFGVNDGDGAVRADLEAVGLSTEDAAVAGELQFFQTAFEVVPRSEAVLLQRALRLGLIGAEEEMALDSIGADGGEFGPGGGLFTFEHDCVLRFRTWRAPPFTRIGT